MRSHEHTQTLINHVHDVVEKYIKNSIATGHPLNLEGVERIVNFTLKTFELQDLIIAFDFDKQAKEFKVNLKDAEGGVWQLAFPVDNYLRG
jgi:hypothetical protein